ncbi:dynein light chain binding protein [Aureococcus anophagefferens]|nr:dynein light chain binding protein [Aureococcus anophagefferens]
MFRTLVELQPRTAAATGGRDVADGDGEREARRHHGPLRRARDVDDLSASLDEKGPYQNVFLQEMEVMNKLLGEIVRSLKELALGFKGELTMSDAMEAVMNSLYMDTVPGKWVKFSWPSRKALSGWLTNFMARLTQLEDWSNNPAEIPKCTFLSYLVNPQSFLTAVNQVAAQKNQWELDKLVSFSDVTRYATFDKVEAVSREGAYIGGLNMQGARWDVQRRHRPPKPKEMFCAMPVMSVKGAVDKADFTGMYNCPVYKTEQRGPTFVYCANLRTKSPFGRWVLAGAALILELTT